MEEVIELIKASAKDFVLSKNEKRDLKTIIQSKNFNKRELDFLRSQIFDVALDLKDNFSKESLIQWIESTTKLTLGANQKKRNSIAYFSPGTTCKSAIITQLKNASESIKICVFTISDNEISDEIISAHHRGIGVKVLTDNDKSFDLGSDIEKINNAGITVKMDTTTNHMHHKFCIIDKKTLITGSYNWTNSAAERNQENILITEDEDLVKAYVREFEKLFRELVNY